MTAIVDPWVTISPWSIIVGNPIISGRTLGLSGDDAIQRSALTTAWTMELTGSWPAGVINRYLSIGPSGTALVSPYSPGIKVNAGRTTITLGGIQYGVTNPTPVTFGSFIGQTIAISGADYAFGFKVYAKPTAGTFACRFTYQGVDYFSGFVASSSTNWQIPVLLCPSIGTTPENGPIGTIISPLSISHALSDAQVQAVYDADLLGRNSISISGSMYRFRPWPSFSITPAISWIQDSAGYWNGSDRGASQDAYEAIASFQGTESILNALEQTLNSNKEAITLGNFDSPLFAPNVDHTGTITATILSIKRNQIQYGTPGHVYELQVGFRAIAPTILSTTPAISSLKVQEGFQADHSYQSPKAFSFNQTAVYADRRSDIGFLEAEFSQNITNFRAILAYILVTARAGAVAFPSSLSTIAYPWGRTRGAATNCKIIAFSCSRKDLNRWALKIKFAENS